MNPYLLNEDLFKTLDKLNAEIATRDLSEIPTEKLIELRNDLLFLLAAEEE